MTRLVRIACLLVLLVIGFVPATASAQSTNGVIHGRLLNGSADNAPISGIEVTMLPVSPQGPGTRVTAMPGSDGSFRFEGLNTAPTQSFVLWAEYHGSRFQLAPTQFEAGAPDKTVDIVVYEPVEQDPGIVILRQSILILPSPSSAQNSVTIVELYELENPSKSAFIGTLLPAAPANAPRTNITAPPSNRASIRLPLPAGAQNLTVLEGIQPNALIQTTDGVADSLPFTPGRKDVVVQYVLPYIDAIVLDKPAAYPTGELTVLVEDGNWGLDADGLVPQGSSELNGEKFQQYRGQGISTGAPIRMIVRGPGLVAQPFEQQGLFTAIIVGAIAIIVVAGVTIPLARRRSKQAMKEEKAAPVVSAQLAAGEREQERLDLIDAIADLDDRRDSGLLDNSEWERLRAPKKDALIRLLREVRGI